MTLRLARLVPDEYDYHYYHEKSGLLLHNNPERGWCAVANIDTIEQEFEEMEEALEDIDEFTDPDAVLPLPDDYEHALPPVWER